MTRLKATYGELEQKTRELAALLAVGKVVTSSFDLEELLSKSLDTIIEVAPVNAAEIWLVDEENALTLRCYRGTHRDAFLEKTRFSLGEGIPGIVAQKRAPILVHNLPDDDRFLRKEVTKAGFHTLCALPLLYQRKLVGALLVAALSAEAIRGQRELRLLEGIGEWLAIAIENAHLYQQVQDKDKARQELLQEMFSIQEEERRRIAHELHDETSQVLSSLSANLEVAVGMLPGGTDEVKSILRKAQTLSTNILEETHKLIYQLRPTLLDDLGLVAATRWLIDNTLGTGGIKTGFKVIGRERRLSTKVETTVFRVIQEAVTNIARHARARNAVVALHFKKGAIAVHISDDGCGFGVAEAVSSKERPRGLGLLGMQERVELINGIISILSYPGSNGTKVEIEIPSG